MPEKIKIQEAWTWGTKLLTDRGLELPRLEAEVLLRSVLNLERAALYVRLTDFMDAEQFKLYRQQINSRAEGCPSQYLTGRQEFMSLSFWVNQDVLIPRPETELLAELALERLKNRPPENYPLLELCTGSGALLVSLLYYLPSLKGVGTDISAEALKVAEQNAACHGVIERAQFIQGDLFQPLREQMSGHKFDLIIANPPYIPTKTIQSLQREVLLYEPRLALDGGEDGLGFYQRIAEEVKFFLNDKGIIMLEIGSDQGKTVPEIFRQTGQFSKVELILDLAGLPRVVLVCS